MRGSLAEAAAAGVATSAASHAPTARQIEVLAAIIATGSYAAAADSLGLSPTTVRGHLVAVRSRLGVETTVQAAYILAMRGVLIVPSVGRRAAQ